MNEIAQDPAHQITVAAVAIHDADCPDTTCSGAALGHAYKLARVALEAAAPLIAAAERERIRQLAIRHKATWLRPCDENDCGHVQRSLHTHHRVPFADLL